MHWTTVTCSRGDSVLVLYIDWSTIQSKEFAQKTVIFCFCHAVLYFFYGLQRVIFFGMHPNDASYATKMAFVVI